MRMMLRVVVDTPAGNTAARDGSMAASIAKALDLLKPEAAYFFDDSRRTAIFVFDMVESSQIPMIVEPLFQGVNAEVFLTPVMNVEDFKKGLAALAGA